MLRIGEVLVARKVVSLVALWPWRPMELLQLSEVSVTQKVVGLGALWAPSGIAEAQ